MTCQERLDQVTKKNEHFEKLLKQQRPVTSCKEKGVQTSTNFVLMPESDGYQAQRIRSTQYEVKSTLETESSAFSQSQRSEKGEKDHFGSGMAQKGNSLLNVDVCEKEERRDTTEECK